MKSMLTVLSTVVAVMLSTSGAQAGIFDGYEGPSFSYCNLETSGHALNLLLIGGSTQRGTVTCENTNGNMHEVDVVVPLGGLSLGVGGCKAEMDLHFVGAEMNINLTPKLMEDIYGALVLGSVIVPWQPNRHVAMSVGVNFRQLGFKAGAGGIQFAKGCGSLANLWVGAVVAEDEYNNNNQ